MPRSNPKLCFIIIPLLVFNVVCYLITFGPNPMSSTHKRTLEDDDIAFAESSQDPALQKQTKSGSNKTIFNELVFDCPEDTDNVEEDSLALYGRPVHGNIRKVLYISMPKCGSRTFVWMAFKLEETRHVGYPINVDFMLGSQHLENAIKTLGQNLRSAQAGAIVHGHYQYVPTNILPENPVYLSMLRDPLSRFESHFYFMRHGDKDMSAEEVRKSLGKRAALPNETLDDCVEKNRGECMVDLFKYLYITSFCGYDPKCSSDQEFALRQAKKNVDKFLVVGIMEDYELTMAVFEKLLPSTFDGARQIYIDSKENSMAKTKTSFKKPPSPKTYSILRERMRYDYRFYNYVKDRFHRLAKRMGVGRCQT